MKKLLLIFLLCTSSAFAQSGSVKIWDGTDTVNVTGTALDVNATIDPSGLATEAKQDTGNASLASIDGKITAVNTGAVVISSGSVTCNAGTNLNTSALATSAIQTTQSGYLDGIEGLLTTIDADTSALAGTVSGTEVQVDVLTLPAVSGSVTCNAGTNLNTSALATEATLSTLNGKVTACNTGAVTISAALPAGTNGIGKLTANSGVDIGDVDVTSIAAGNNNIGDVDAIQSGTWTVQPGNTANTTAWLVSPRPATTGGLSITRNIDLDETDVAVKGSAGQLYGYFIYNNAASTRFVKLYNATTANVTVGSTTPVMTIPIPAGSAANVEFSMGIAFSTAITAACLTGVADSDTGAPSANDCVVNFFYN